MGRHHAGHRRAVHPRADPRTAAQPARSISYLVRYTNAPWLVIEDPGAPDHGLFARDKDGNPLVIDRRTGKVVRRKTSTPGREAGSQGRGHPADGRKARPVFELMAENISTTHTHPTVAERCGAPPRRIRQACRRTREGGLRGRDRHRPALDRLAGRKHDKMIGRPVSFHAMRGISAHSNGFQTAARCTCCRSCSARSRCPAASASSRPTPSRREPIPSRMPESHPGAAARRAASRLPAGPRRPAAGRGRHAAHRQGVYLGCPLSAHGLMHMVISNAARGDPYGSTRCSSTWPTWPGTRR
jgi:hypothetical protein